MGLFSVQQLRPLIIIIEVNLLLEMNENNQLYLEKEKFNVEDNKLCLIVSIFDSNINTSETGFT